MIHPETKTTSNKGTNKRNNNNKLLNSTRMYGVYIKFSIEFPIFKFKYNEVYRTSTSPKSVVLIEATSVKLVVIYSFPYAKTP